MPITPNDQLYRATGGEPVSVSELSAYMAEQTPPNADGVQSVNNKSPDSNGNVQLSASDVGAITSAQLDARLSAAQRTAINALVSPTTDYADLTAATAAIKSIIDALKAS